jgi:uncharacterized protein YggE
MMRAWWMIIAMVVALAFAGAAQAEMVTGEATVVPRPMLSVNGTGTVQVPPDTVRVTASIITDAATVAEAREKNAQVAQRAMNAVAALELRNVAMKTADYTMKRVTTTVHGNVKANLSDLQVPWNAAGLQTSGDMYGIDIPITLGYEASNSITVRVQGVPPDELSSSAGKIIDALMDAGTNQITSVAYSLEKDSTAARREALAKAVKDAQMTADVVAATAGRKIVGIRSISPSYYPMDYAQNRVQFAFASGPAGPGEVTPTPLASGLLEVTAQVQVNYELDYNPGDTEFLAGPK